MVGAAVEGWEKGVAARRCQWLALYGARWVPILGSKGTGFTLVQSKMLFRQSGYVSAVASSLRHFAQSWKASLHSNGELCYERKARVTFSTAAREISGAWG